VSLQAYYSFGRNAISNTNCSLCREEGVGVMPWSPLSGGFLSGKYRRDNPIRKRSAHELSVSAIDEARGFDAVESTEEMAKQKGATVAQVALAWLSLSPA